MTSWGEYGVPVYVFWWKIVESIQLLMADWEAVVSKESFLPVLRTFPGDGCVTPAVTCRSCEGERQEPLPARPLPKEKEEMIQLMKR